MTMSKQCVAEPMKGHLDCLPERKAPALLATTTQFPRRGRQPHVPIARCKQGALLSMKMLRPEEARG